jgi:hypothetical protein
VPDDAAERLRQLEALIRSSLLASARQAGVTLDDDTIHALLRMDTTLNAQGIAVWLAKGMARKTESTG